MQHDRSFAKRKSDKIGARSPDAAFEHEVERLQARNRELEDHLAAANDLIAALRSKIAGMKKTAVERSPVKAKRLSKAGKDIKALASGLSVIFNKRL